MAESYLAGLGQLHHALLEIGQGSLHQAAHLLKMVQQGIPQRLLAQHLHSNWLMHSLNSPQLLTQFNVRHPASRPISPCNLPLSGSGLCTWEALHDHVWDSPPRRE